MGKIRVKKTQSGRIIVYMDSRKLGVFKSKELATKYILDNKLNRYAKP